MALYFTQKGLQKLESQISAEEAVAKKAGENAGEAAGAGCDWHDNADYEDALRRLELGSRRVLDLREETRNAVIVEIQEQTGRVSIGNTVRVTLQYRGAVSEIRQEFTIGAYRESDPKNGLITYDSPLARVLIGKEEGDSVEGVSIGDRVIEELTIDEILPPSEKYNSLIQKFYGTE